ncbi:response regulator, partial [Myxococcota bacterium]|nr:response regulator [Myxococcota bacterium]
MTKMILVADDSKTIRKAVQMTLGDSSRQILEAGDGQTALLVAREKKPALIIAEDYLPGMDGYSLLSAIKQESALSGIPVIILRSKGKPFDSVRGVGAEGSIEKPFLPDALLELVGKAATARAKPAPEVVEEIIIDAETPDDNDLSMDIALDFGTSGAVSGGELAMPPIPARVPSSPGLPVIPAATPSRPAIPVMPAHGSAPIMSSNLLEKKPTGSMAPIEAEDSSPHRKPVKETVFMSSFAPPSSSVPSSGAAPNPFAFPVAPAAPLAPAA